MKEFEFLIFGGLREVFQDLMGVMNALPRKKIKKHLLYFAYILRESKDPISQIHEPCGLRQSVPFYRWKYQGAEKEKKI